MSNESKANNFRTQVKERLFDRAQTVTDLAQEIGHARTTVSRAINSYRFPRVVKKIRQELGIHA